MTENEVVPVEITALKAGERAEALIAAVERELGVDVDETGNGHWRVEVPAVTSDEAAVESVVSALESHDDGDDWGEHLEVHPAAEAELD